MTPDATVNFYHTKNGLIVEQVYEDEESETYVCKDAKDLHDVIAEIVEFCDPRTEFQLTDKGRELYEQMIKQRDNENNQI